MALFWPSPTCLRAGVSYVVKIVLQLKPKARRVGLSLLLTAVIVQISSPILAAEKFDPRLTWSEREAHSLDRTFAHVAEFSPVSVFALALPKCANVRQPEALLTPDPELPPQESGPLVGVSFIVGSDGHVHSAFVTRSGGPTGDQAVLRAIRSWRYRPALCNGVPTDSEARVRFSVHE